jgi:DNA-binding CsgD family transcriptional regulator
MWVIREEQEKALPYFEEILDLSEKYIIPLNSLAIAHIYLHNIYEMMGDYRTAYGYLEDYVYLNDSLNKSRNLKAIAQLEMKSRFEESLQEATIKQQELEIKRQRNESFYMLVIAISVLGLLAVILFYFLQRGKLRHQKIENERNLLKRKNLEFDKEKLEMQLDYKNKELATNVMYLARTNEFINSISEKLLQSKLKLTRENQQMIDRIINELQNFTDQDVWQEFEVRFQQVHSDFYTKLHDSFPDLTANEKKLCAFLKLNMTTKEISALTYQSPNSITVARSRLRKKLGIDRDENLISFLESL